MFLLDLLYGKTMLLLDFYIEQNHAVRLITGLTMLLLDLTMFLLDIL